MITIIHGEDVVKSRLELEKIKQQNQQKEIVVLDGRKIDLTQMKVALETKAMFDDSRLVIIENLLSGRKSSMQEEIISYLAKPQFSADLIICEEISLARGCLAKLRADRVLEFKPEQIIFKFLDSLQPRNSQQMLRLLIQCLKTTAPEIIFYMIIRQFRFLLLVKNEVTSGIEELNRLSPWQKQRLTNQAKKFEGQQLLNIYRQLLQIDIQQKTGQNAFDLKKTLEIFILNV